MYQKNKKNNHATQVLVVKRAMFFGSGRARRHGAARGGMGGMVGVVGMGRSWRGGRSGAARGGRGGVAVADTPETQVTLHDKKISCSVTEKDTKKGASGN